MAHLDHMILADGATVRPDGKIDIYGAAWDTIRTNGVPTMHPQIAIALRVLLSAQEAESPHQIDVVLLGPDGPELARAHAEVQAIPADLRLGWPVGEQIALGSILNFQNQVFPEFGAYHIAVLWDGTELRPPLRLKVEPTPEIQEPDQLEST